MNIETFKIQDVKCIDDGETKGIVILVSQKPYKIVSLIFDKSVPHKQTDELARTLEKMGLAEIVVQTGY